MVSEYQMDRFSLTDLEKLTGIKSDTIRIWESRYRILTPKRTATNRRLYSDRDLIRLLNLTVLYRSGHKISRIAALNDSEAASKAAEILKSSGEADLIAGALTAAMTTYNETSVNEVLLRSVINTGFEATFEKVVFPFLKRMGIMWQTGALTVGEEHFISEIFRKRIISATDSLPVLPAAASKRALLFLPEEEYHELALLYYRYLIVKAGHIVLYLGQSTPLDAAISAAAEWNPDTVVTGVVSGMALDSPEEYLKQLSEGFRGKKVIVSGLLGSFSLSQKHENIYPASGRESLLKIIG